MLRWPIIFTRCLVKHLVYSNQYYYYCASAFSILKVKSFRYSEMIQYIAKHLEEKCYHDCAPKQQNALHLSHYVLCS